MSSQGICIIRTILLNLLGIVVVFGGEFSKDVDAGADFLAAGKSEDVKKIVDSLNGQQEGKPYAALLKARVYYAAGKVEMALAILREHFSTEEKIQMKSVDLQLSYGDTLRTMRLFDEAALVANRIGILDKGIGRVRAGELLSDVFADRRRWQDSLGWITNSINTLEVVKYSEDERAYLSKLRAKRLKIEQVLELLRHGLGFRLYRIGNEQRFSRQNTAAVATYDKLLVLYVKNKNKPIPEISGIDDPRVDDWPISDIYAAAASVYRASSLLNLQKFPEATQALVEIIRDANHPYRPEAMRLLGDVILDDKGDVAAAERQFSAAIVALDGANLRARSLDKYRVPEASKEITKAPAEMKTVEGWGNIEWFRPDPRQIINAETCEWYTKYQCMQAKIQRSMCYFLMGKITKAIDDLDAITEFDTRDRALTIRGMPSNYLRLRDGFRSGKLYATQAELAEFKGKSLISVVRAEILFETEQWDAAVVAYDRLANDDRVGLSQAAMAYLDYARGCALVFSGNTREATRFISGFSGDKPKYKNTVTYWRSLFLLANLSVKDELAYLTQGAKNCPDFDFANDVFV